MEKDEYISIKEFSERANVSVQSIYQRLNGLNNPLNQYFKLVESRKMLNTRALWEIYGVEVEQPFKPFKGNDSTFSTLDSTPKQQENTINDKLFDTILKQVDTLEKELEVKNKQIDTLSRLLDQSQQLQALTEQKYKALEQQQKEVVEEPKKKWWQVWK